MTDEDVNKIGGMVDSKLEAFREDINDPKTGLKKINQKLDALWDQTVRLTEDMEEVKITVNKLPRTESPRFSL